MLRNWAFTRKTILRSASKDVSVASKDNIFKIRRPVRDSPFSGAIFQTLMQDLDVEFNDPNKEPLEIEALKTNKRHQARGQTPIIRTKWWLNQGPHLISEVAAINFEYNEPDYDEYKLSGGLVDYVNFYGPPMRFKNQHVVITQTKNETAAPFIQFFFKDGRNCHVDCTNSSLAEIKQHVESTFCKAPGDHSDAIEDPYDENGRHSNPYMHYQNKPISTATQYRLLRKCLCQQPGQYGCTAGCSDTYATWKYQSKRPGNMMPVDDNFYRRRNLRRYWNSNPAGMFLTMKAYEQKQADYRPHYKTEGNQNFKNYIKDMSCRENRQISRLQNKILANRKFRYVKELNQKKIHAHWSEFFWHTESGLAEDYEELYDKVDKENKILARPWNKGGANQKHKRGFWRTVPPAI